MANSPFFTHDCKACQYLGSITFPARLLGNQGKEYTSPKRADLYCCGSKESSKGIEEAKTIVARFSSQDNDYASSPCQIIKKYYFSDSMATGTPALIAGYWFAVSKGLIAHKTNKPVINK